MISSEQAHLSSVPHPNENSHVEKWLTAKIGMPQNVANLCLSSEGIDEVPLRETFEVLYKAASTCETSGIDSITIGGPRDLYRGIQHLGLQAIVGSFVRLAPVTKESTCIVETRSPLSSQPIFRHQNTHKFYQYNQ